MRRQLLCTMMAILLGGAQAVDGQARKPRTGGIAPAPAPAPVPRNPPVQDYGYYYPRHAAHGTVPVIIDGGRVYADFGYGYEQVLRSCAATYGSGYVQPGYAPPAYTPPSYQPPSYTPPSYSTSAGSTGSASARNTTTQASQSGAPQQPTSSSAARTAPRAAGIAPIPPQAAAPPAHSRGPACWTTDAYGRIFVLRP